MSFKDKTRNCINAGDSYIQKEKTIQMHTMWTDIMDARKETVSGICLLKIAIKI